MMQLAAPHTWPAAILPVLFTTSVAIARGYAISVTLMAALLIICILMQSAVNTFNDYYDFVKGTDSVENQDDPTDAVLVYNNINPRSTLILGISFLVVAFVLGAYVVWVSSWVTLVIGLVGALIIVMYSAGKTPISYLPIGEYVSGITMGGLISLACYFAYTGDLAWEILLLSFPVIAGIGLIMFTNNTCDIEKDREAGRKTQAVLLGRERARTAYHGVVIIWVIAIIVLIGVYFTPGLIGVPFMLLILYPTLSMMFANPLTSETRGPAMGTCLNLNIGLGISYCLCIFIGGSTTLLW